MLLRIKSGVTVLVIIFTLHVCLAPAISVAAKKKKKAGVPEVAIVPPPAPVVAPTPAPKPNNGSLYTSDAQGSSLLSDFKARRAGDLVFVNVVEATNANVESSARRGRDSGTLAGIGTVAGVIPVAGAAAGALVGALGQRKFEGNGSTERNSALQARIVARVVEVFPNGDLRIQAQKMVKINKENEMMTLSGIVRTRDVAADNSVPTTAVGDLLVELNGKGVASDDNAPGWLFRLVDKIGIF